MPQARKITLGTQEFEPESITRENVAFQDLTSPLQARDMLFLNRNADENSQPNKPLVRVISVRLLEEVTDGDGKVQHYPSTATLRLTMDRRSTAAHRQRMLEAIAQATANVDVVDVVTNPSWMF